MKFISCRKCGRRDLRCNCSYSRSLVLISLMLLLMSGCSGSSLRSSQCTVIDSNGTKYENMTYLTGGDGWNRLRSDKNKIHEFSGNHVIIEE